MRTPLPLLAAALLAGCYQLTGLGTNPGPEAVITSHEDGDSVEAGQLATLRGIVSDPNDRAEQLTVSWWLGEARICGPTAASAEGDTDCAMAFAPGLNRVSLEVRDPRGAGASDVVELNAGGDDDDAADDDDTTANDDDATANDDDAADDDDLADDDDATADDDDAFDDDDLADDDDAVDDDDLADDDDAANAPPSQPVVVIQPSSPFASDDLIAFLSTPSFDPEGNFVTYTYDWTRDGQPVASQTSSIVPASETTAGETWSVTVTPSDGVLSGLSDSDVAIIAADPITSPCSLPPLYDRVTHSQGSVDLIAVDWAPDGSHALILGYPGQLYRYDGATQDVALVSDGGGERWYDVRFSEAGDYALVVGATAASSGTPVVYQYDGAALTALTVPALSGGGPPNPGRIDALDQQPGTDNWVLLSDNGQGSSNPIAYVNELTIDSSGVAAPTWLFGGALNISQVASSIAWGTRLGQPIAVAVSTYTDMLWYEPNLASPFSRESVTNTGNLRKVVFDPTNSDRAWVLSAGAGSSVAPWQGTFLNSGGNYHSFTGWTVIDFDVDDDGIWRMFVGRNGQVWFTDGPWDSPQNNVWSNQAIANFSSPPWNGGSNTYLNAVAFRPGSCEALIVGDATAGQGLIVRAQLQ